MRGTGSRATFLSLTSLGTIPLVFPTRSPCQRLVTGDASGSLGYRNGVGEVAVVLLVPPFPPLFLRRPYLPGWANHLKGIPPFMDLGRVACTGWPRTIN
jgi:hypothetical protein